VVERRPLKSTSGNGAQPSSLEQQIAAALAADKLPPSSELSALLAEVDVAAAAAAASAAAERERALDLSSDPAAAQQLILIAELRARRLEAARPRLEQRLQAALGAEYSERWDAHYRRLAAKVEEAAERFRRYPALAAEMVELLNSAAAVDKEVGDLHIRAVAGEHRRLPQVELLARGLKAFSAVAPSVVRDLKLPDWQDSQRLLYPRQQPFDPSFYAPAPYDEQCSPDWWKRGEQQRAAAAERERRELVAADRARRQFYGEIVPPEPAAEAPPETVPPPEPTAPPATE
jgi:hypothetical protein